VIPGNHRSGCHWRRLWAAGVFHIRREATLREDHWRTKTPASDTRVSCRLIWSCAFLLVASTASAVDVVDVRWGFDGKVVRNRFNVLSILVNNPKPDAFDGELVLHKRLPGGQPIDAQVVEATYVGPFGEAWVRFYPYVGNTMEEWTLEIRPVKGRRGPSITLPQTRFGWPARVLIETDQNAARRSLPVQRLPDVLFPPFVTATDALQAVLLDAPPRWDEPRRQAFLDWLYRGGTVFVLHTATGSDPAFPANLGVLNSPLETSTYGAGQIIRVPRSRTELTRELLTDLFAVLPKRLVQDNQGNVKELPAVDSADDQEEQRNFYADASDPLSASSFLSRLRNMTKPKHNWALLHLLFWAYIGLVFPGCYLLGRQWTDYRVVYVSLLGVVVLFSVLFAVVGQRGYGESTAVNSVAIARPLPDGHVDVSQWSNAFVTLGGDYTFRHDGSGVLYSTCNIAEEVKGAIRNGAEAEFLADVPPFSSREFANRAKVKSPLSQLAVERCEVSGDQLRALTIAIDDKFPRNDELLLAMYGNRFYKISRDDNQLQLDVQLGTAAGYLRVNEYTNYAFQYGGMYDRHERPVLDQYRDLFTPLISRSLNVSKTGEAEALSLPLHIIRLFYFAPLPPELCVKNKYLGKNDGWALYAVDVPVKPEGS